MKKLALITIILISIMGCNQKAPSEKKSNTSAKVPFIWENASIYFLMTDRFYNADTLNDVSYYRTKKNG